MYMTTGGYKALSDNIPPYHLTLKVTRCHSRILSHEHSDDTDN